MKRELLKTSDEFLQALEIMGNLFYCQTLEIMRNLFYCHHCKDTKTWESRDKQTRRGGKNTIDLPEEVITRCRTFLRVRNLNEKIKMAVIQKKTNSKQV